MKTTHGIRHIQIPGSSGLRSAENAQSQYVPAPFPDRLCEGTLICRMPPAGDVLFSERADADGPAGDTACPVEDAGGRLRLLLGDKTVFLSDWFDNNRSMGFLGSGELLGYDALQHIPGRYDIFSGIQDIRVVSDGPLATVTRVRSVPKERDTGAAFPILCAYDIILYKEMELCEITASFTGDSPQRVADFKFAELKFSRGEATEFTGGLPHYHIDRLDEVEVDYEKRRYFRPYAFSDYLTVGGVCGSFSFVGGNPMITLEEKETVLRADDDAARFNKDIRTASCSNPFRAYLVYGVRPASAWIHDLPDAVRAELPGKSDYVLCAGRMETAFRRLKGGVELVSVRDRNSGRVFMNNGGGLLFNAVVRRLSDERQYMICSDSGWSSAEVFAAPGRITMQWADHTEKALSGITVLLTGICGDCNDIRWTLSVHNANADLCVLQAEYPRLSFDADESTRLFFPAGSGETRKELRNRAVHQYLSYTDAFCSMQYMCLWDNDKQVGMYYGIHDPDGAYKILLGEKQAGLDRGYLTCLYPAEGIDEGANTVHPAGTCVWRIYDGDWYEAAMIYKEWVITHALWIPEIGPDGREDIPDWLRGTTLWLRSYVRDDDEWTDSAIRAAKEAGVRTACHVYAWHEIPGDNDYPHYFPAREPFLRNYRRIREAGIPVMPYINARLWDMLDHGLEDFRFGTEAKPAATKDRHGRVIFEDYGSREEDGRSVHLAVMCPSSSVWQEKVRELCDRILNELGTDAVYVDQIAAMQPVMCCDRTHSHRPGGGSWWTASQMNLLDHIDRVRSPEKAYTSECNAENYMKRFHGYLTWPWGREGQVPAFSAVYSNRIVLFGRVSDSASDVAGFRMFFAQSLLFGEQLGWFSPEFFLNHPEKEYIIRLARVREQFSDYFLAGDMLKPPIVTGQNPLCITRDIATANLMFTCPAVMGALWSRNGRKLLLLVNTGETELATEANLHISESPELIFSNRLRVRTVNGRFSVTLPPKQILCAEF